MHRTRTIVVLLALGTILCAPGARAGEQKANAPAYRSWIDPHVSPKRRPDEIVGMVRTLMQRSRKVTEAQGTEPGQGAASSDPILSVDCVEGDDVGAIVGRSAIKMPGATLWVVRVRGRFIKDVPGGSGAQIENDTGYYVIDDATGQVVAVGSPTDH